MITITRFLQPEDIMLDLDVSDKAQLFQAIGQHMEQAYAVSQEDVILSLTRREMARSTGLGQGCAIPHARLHCLDKIRILFVRLKFPMPFDAPDDKPVSHLFVLLVPAPATDEHLQLLAHVAEMFSDHRLRTRIDHCRSPSELKRIFDAWPN